MNNLSIVRMKFFKCDNVLDALYPLFYFYKLLGLTPYRIVRKNSCLYAEFSIFCVAYSAAMNVLFILTMSIEIYIVFDYYGTENMMHGVLFNSFAGNLFYFFIQMHLLFQSKKLIDFSNEVQHFDFFLPLKQKTTLLRIYIKLIVVMGFAIHSLSEITGFTSEVLLDLSVLMRLVPNCTIHFYYIFIPEMVSLISIRLKKVNSTLISLKVNSKDQRLNLRSLRTKRDTLLVSCTKLQRSLSIPMLFLLLALNIDFFSFVWSSYYHGYIQFWKNNKLEKISAGDFIRVWMKSGTYLLGTFLLLQPCDQVKSEADKTGRILEKLKIQNDIPAAVETEVPYYE